MFGYCDAHNERYHVSLGCTTCEEVGEAPQEDEEATEEVVERPEAVKFDNEKLRVDLIPFRAMLKMVHVMQFGAMKYDERNWEAGMGYHRLWRGAVSHLIKWFYGEDNDPETGLSHLAHAMCCISFLLEYEDTKPEFDDRPKIDDPEALAKFVELFDFRPTKEMQEYLNAGKGC